MNQKTSLMFFLLIPLILFLSLSPLFSQTLIKFCAKGGINISRPIAMPENLSLNGNSYQVNYIPGYSWAGEFAIQHNAITISSGLGYKRLNFNFKRRLSIARSWGGQESLTMIRLLYLYTPLNFYFNVNNDKNLFLILGGHYCWLINDINFEIWENESNTKISHEALDWFNPNAIFLFFGAGIRIHQNMNILIEVGLTPKDVDSARIAKEGDYYGSNFNFSKKLLNFCITLNYDLPILSY